MYLYATHLFSFTTCLNAWACGNCLIFSLSAEQGRQYEASKKGRCSQLRLLLPAGHGFVIGKDLVGQLVDKLIKTQVHLVRKSRW